MKVSKLRRIGLGCVIALLAVTVFAQEETSKTLTRAQWLRQIGSAVSDATVLDNTMAQVSPADRVEFAQRLIKAASRLPVAPEEKAATLVKVAVASISGVTGENKMKVIAEVFAGVPIEFLPVVTEELAKRFDQEHNGLSDEQYAQIASDTLNTAIERNKSTDLPSVRNTFVILAFLRGTKNTALRDTLVAQLPDERMRNLAFNWVNSVMERNDYETLLAAADVDAPILRAPVLFRLMGHSLLDRLLADLYQNTQWERGEGEVRTATGDSVWRPLSEVWQIVEYRTSPGEHSADYGINRVPYTFYPQGYQNQRLDVENTRRKKYDSGISVRCCIRYR